MRYDAVLTAYYAVALTVAASAFWPDRWALGDRAGHRSPPPPDRDAGPPSRCPCIPPWGELVSRGRHIATHAVCLSAMLWLVALMVWYRVDSAKVPTEEEAVYVLCGALGLGVLAAVANGAVAEWVVSALSVWLLAYRLHVTPDRSLEWLRQAGASLGLIVIGVAVAAALTRLVIVSAVRWMEYPLSVGFALCFCPAFLRHGYGVYVSAGPRLFGKQADRELWLPLLGAVLAGGALVLVQFAYTRCGPAVVAYSAVPSGDPSARPQRDWVRGERGCCVS